MAKIERTNYDGVAMVLHWVTALLIIFMLVFGEELIEAAEHGDGGTFTASIHISAGIAILALTLFRIVWRMSHPAPPLPDTMKRWEIIAAKVTHFAIYALLIAIPLTGWLAFGGFLREEPAMAAVRIFGLLPHPAGPVLGGAAEDAHEIASNLMIGLAVLHVLAALKHQFLDDDGVFRRMLPY